MKILSRKTKSLSRLVVVSDLHVGSVVGLWPKEFRVEHGGKYKVNKFQGWLLSCWERMVEEVGKMDPKPDIILNGDGIQGTNPRDGQLITNKRDIQAAAAYELLLPLSELARKMWWIRGTEWHEGKSSEYVEGLAKMLKCVPHPHTEQWSWWELFYRFKGGPVAHIAHHIGCSSVAWYEATVPLRDLLLFLAELARSYRGRVVDVEMIVRSHRHRFVHVKVPPGVQAVVTPGWQLRTAFAHKRASAMLPQVGYVIIEWDGTDLIVRDRIFPLPTWFMHVEE